MSHRLRVSQVELHGFAVNAPVLLRLQPDLHPPVMGYVDLSVADPVVMGSWPSVSAWGRGDPNRCGRFSSPCVATF
uniref:hypothetical protein n=1 Tax=Synechococcus sp. UW106 TaxID=368495 RepID=UPI001482EFD4|nr:hypothetical protein [Synechococcus sp. UW106]